MDSLARENGYKIIKMLCDSTESPDTESIRTAIMISFRKGRLQAGTVTAIVKQRAGKPEVWMKSAIA